MPAPAKGERARGVKGAQARFANALAGLMNELGREGWEYLRAETLPCEERQGLTGKVTRFQNMLIFRRQVTQDAELKAEQKAETATPQVVAVPDVTGEDVTEEDVADKIVATAVASLRANAPQGAAPVIELVAAGPAPALGPATPASKGGVAAE